MMASIGLMGFVLISVVATSGSGQWDFVDYLLYTAGVLLFAFVPGAILVPYWTHPVSGEKQIENPGLDFSASSFSEGFSDAMQRAIIKFERHGFWRGFLTPILVVAAVLAVATAIGMINYYVL